MNAEDLKRIELARAELDRQFGKGAVMRLDEEVTPWPSVSTGCFTLDSILGIDGLPKGRIVEIYGPEGVGKSTLCLSVIANAQKENGICLFIDAEHALDPAYAKALGVNLEDLFISQPSCGEEAIDILEMMIKTGSISVAVVDSVAALVPKAELDGTMGDNHMGLQPRLMARAMRKIAGVAAETKTLIIFTNQIREKIGVMFGNPETQPGGRALKFQASVRIDMRRIEDVKAKNDGSIIGTRVKATTKKNKLGPPLRVAEFNIIYGEGVDNMRCIVDLGEERGIVKKAGAWYGYQGTQLGQGKDNASAFLRENPEIAEQIKKEIAESV